MSQKLHIAAYAAVILSAPPAMAEPLPEVARFFNDCAGRVAGHLSVHGWNAGGAVTTDHLESIDAIVRSVTTPEHESELAARQSAARAAHVALLAHAMEYGDLTAIRQAREDVVRCREAVLVP